MKVSVMIEFEVESDVEGFNEQIAKSAAEDVVFNNACLTHSGIQVTEQVEVWVDGHGNCDVTLVDR